MNEIEAPPTAAATPRGLPPYWYTSSEIYALEVERVFRREWTLIGRADEVASAGDFLCLEVLGEPLVMIRGEDESVLSQLAQAVGSGESEVALTEARRFAGVVAILEPEQRSKLEGLYAEMESHREEHQERFRERRQQQR